jgi:hypothetical protein
MEPSELNLLYVAIQNFREAMEGDLRLTDLDRISLENYISLLDLLTTPLHTCSFVEALAACLSGFRPDEQPPYIPAIRLVGCHSDA